MQMGSLGFPELLVILFVVLLLFGPKRLPEVSRGLGKAVRDFRKGLESGLEEVTKSEPPAGGAPRPEQTASGGTDKASAQAAAAPLTPARPPAEEPVGEAAEAGGSDAGPGQDPPARAA
ncbi:MAG: twin-arginine translocase TatA/TatE family subunit [Deinococcales bacterium]|jgi:TatA/E family protein of Tat protein translocase